MENNITSYTITLIEDENGDVILPFPPEFCEQNDWRTDDILKFILNDDESCTIINISREERVSGKVDKS
jgi:hypothetical protein